MSATALDLYRLQTWVRQLCALRAPSAYEGPIVKYIEEFCQRRRCLGLQWSYVDVPIPASGGDGSPVIIVRVPGSGKPILLASHMDTVPLPEGAPHLVEDNGVLKTDGNSILGTDDRAGVALALAMIDSALALKRCLEVVFTVQEELGCLGSGHLVRSFFQAEIAYNLDGENDVGSAIVEAPQKSRFIIETTGRAAHAALDPHRGRNAIVQAAHILREIPIGQVDSYTTINIGKIEGGGPTNVVPDRATVTGEVRSRNKASFAYYTKMLDVLCSESLLGEGFGFNLTWQHTYSGYSLDVTSPVTTRFRNACSTLGYDGRLLSSFGGGDANNLNSIGIPTLVFGMGMHHIHTNDEYIVWKELEAAAVLLSHTIFEEFYQ